jgi:hypothetical protein
MIETIKKKISNCIMNVPSKPSIKPIHLTDLLAQLKTTARITAFKPGQSPPPLD